MDISIEKELLTFNIDRVLKKEMYLIYLLVLVIKLCGIIKK
jgi:hypothetical protein